MRIQPTNRKINVVMALDEGDIFKYMDEYYIAGEFIAVKNCRECYNLTDNRVLEMRFNPEVEYWHGDEAILKLCDEVE